jgi:hypothetical protein
MHWSGQPEHCALSGPQKERFVYEGFLKFENAFSQETAAEAREILWRATGCKSEDKTTWERPVVRLGDFAQEPFRRAVNSPLLLASFDELVGVNRWVPRESLGTFVVRFPHADDPGDTGWHIDASFPPDQGNSSPGNYLDWRVNFRSKGRALLMLFLFSDVGERDAPTRVRVGSHLRIPKLLAPLGEDGLSAMEIGIAAAQETRGMPEISATGSAGTVYLCHPFLVHAAQPHRGERPRFLAQPPLISRVPCDLERNDGAYSLVERAIILGLRERTIA